MLPSDSQTLQSVELELIQRDTRDLGRVTRHPRAGHFAGATAPLVGLVVEGSHGYISRSRRLRSVIGPTPELFSRFSELVTKMRAHLKLFDDEGLGRRLAGPERTTDREDTLIALLEEARHLGKRLFKDEHLSKGRLLGPLVARLAPDLGVIFCDGHAISTTHTLLPALGFTVDKLRAITNLGELLNERFREFGEAIGKYIAILLEFFAALDGAPCASPPAIAVPEVGATRTDFHGSEFYGHAEAALPLTAPRFVTPAIMALGYINCAIRLLPQLLHEDSNLLFRFQFLCAYHARKTLDACLAPGRLLPQLAARDLEILDCVGARNMCAHYGLGFRSAAPDAVVAAADPFGAAVLHYTRASRADVIAAARQWLLRTSDAVGTHFSKSRLLPLKPLFGENT